MATAVPAGDASVTATAKLPPSATAPPPDTPSDTATPVAAGSSIRSGPAASVAAAPPSSPPAVGAPVPMSTVSPPASSRSSATAVRVIATRRADGPVNPTDALPEFRFAQAAPAGSGLSQASV